MLRCVGIHDNNEQSYHSLPKGDRAWAGEASRNLTRHPSNLEIEQGSSVARRGDGVDDLDTFRAMQAAGYRGKDKDFYKPSSPNGWDGRGKGKANGYYYDQGDHNSSKYFDDDYAGGSSRREMYNGYTDEQSLRREIHATRKVRLPAMERISACMHMRSLHPVATSTWGKKRARSLVIIVRRNKCTLSHVPKGGGGGGGGDLCHNSSK